MADFNQLSRFAKLFGTGLPGLDVKPLSPARRRE